MPPVTLTLIAERYGGCPVLPSTLRAWLGAILLQNSLMSLMPKQGGVGSFSCHAFSRHSASIEPPLPASDGKSKACPDERTPPCSSIPKFCDMG